MAKISVIIPVYNVGKYLSKCLESIVNQTFRDIEIICVDDGSTDNSLKILKEFASKDSRIKILTQNNAGAGAARNKGLESASGEYLYFIDSDDYADTNLLEKLYSKITKTNSDICICKTRYCNSSDTNSKSNFNQFSDFPLISLFKNIYYRKIFNRHNSSINLFQLCNVPVFTKLYRHEFIKRNEIKFQEIRTCNDVFFNFYSLACAESIVLINERLINHIERKNSITSHRSKHIECVILAFSALENELNKHNLMKELRYTLYRRKRTSFKYELEQIKDLQQRKTWEKKLNQYLFNKQKSPHSCKFYHLLKKNLREYPKEIYPEFLKKWYKKRTGETLNLDNPQTFNEKIQWLKLYDDNPLKTKLADKYLVRDWVKEKIGEEYLIPLLGVWDSFDEIDFDKLPNKFVLKCNHGCGYNICVPDKSKFNRKEARKKINNWMQEDFAFKYGLELQYSDIPRKIIAEEYIENTGTDLYDYKFWCFDGKVKYIQFISSRKSSDYKMAFYDRNWNKQEFITGHRMDENTIMKPENLDFYINTVEKLVKDFSFVRADFYIVDKKLYFGELTFTPLSGCGKWVPEKYNLEFGKMLKLPTKSIDYAKIS